MTLNGRLVAASWGVGRHIEERLGLSQSRRWPEPPKWPPQRLIGCWSKLTGAPVALPRTQFECTWSGVM